MKSKAPPAESLELPIAQVEEPSFEIVVQNSTKEITDPNERESITSGYAPLWENIQKRMKAASAVTSDPKAAFRARNDLVPVRTEIERTRKALKEASLKKGKAIDGLAAALTYDIAQEEARLKEIETAAAKAEEARIEGVRTFRMGRLTPIITAETLIPPNLATITDAEFERYVSEQKDLAEIRAARASREAADKLELERQAEEKRQADEEERLRVAAENTRLKADAAAKEAEAKAAKDAADAELAKVKAEAKAEEDRLAAIAKRAADDAAAKLKAEQDKAAKDAKDAKDKADKEAAAAKALADAELAKAQAETLKAQKEAKALADAEAAKLAAERLAADKAAKAPDVQKLRLLAQNIRQQKATVLALTTAKGKRLAPAVLEAIEALALRVDAAAETF